LADDEHSEESGAPAWMATFADLATLLLTFFVLLLTFAEMDVEKFRDALGSVQAALGTVPSGAPGVLDASPNLSILDKIPTPGTTTSGDGSGGESELREIEQTVDRMIREQKLGEYVDVNVSSRGVVVRVKGHLFFNPGTARLRRGAKPVLDELSELVAKYPHSMAIEGHTDNIPIRSGGFSSNWELSTARAYSTLRYLQEELGVDPKRVHIAGFADTAPVASNETREGRAKNRRVEFIFFRAENSGD